MMLPLLWALIMCDIHARRCRLDDDSQCVFVLLKILHRIEGRDSQLLTDEGYLTKEFPVVLIRALLS